VAERTGLSKSAVQAALRILSRRQLIRTHKATRTAVPEYFVQRPWAR
jgi:DNA-binding GntR family transcriptional regulator